MTNASTSSSRGSPPPRAAQKPHAKRHIRIDLALLASGSKGNGAPELALHREKLRETALEVFAQFEGEGGDEGFEEVFGDGDTGELGEEGKGIDVGGLGDFDGGEARVAARWRRGRARSWRSRVGPG